MTKEITPVETFVFNGNGRDIALSSRLGYPQGIAIPLSYIRMLELPIANEIAPSDLLIFLDMGGLATYQISAMVAASIAVKMLETIFLNARIKIPFAGQWLDRVLKVREDMMEFPDADVDGLPGTPEEGKTSGGDETDKICFTSFYMMMCSKYSEYYQQRTLTEGHAFYMKYRDVPGGLARDFATYILQTVQPPAPVQEEEETAASPRYSSVMQDPLFMTLRRTLQHKQFRDFCRKYSSEGREAAVEFVKTLNVPGLEGIQ